MSAALLRAEAMSVRRGRRVVLAPCDVTVHPGEVLGRDMWQEGSGINVDCVAAGRLYNRHAFFGNMPAQIGGGNNAIVKVVFLQRFS